MKVTNPIHPVSRAAWRKWLAANHDCAKEAWLVYDKKASGSRNLSYADAVEEALCFGWIDGVVKPIDEYQYAQRFTPRKKRSKWSAVNRARFAKMVEARLMTPPGDAMGPRDAPPVAKRWSADEPLPEFVDRALKGKARGNFEALPRGERQNCVRWIIEAKQEETRARRLEKAIEKLARNERFRV